MITNFEELTFELTDDELDLVPTVVRGLKLRTENNPIKEPEIIEGLNRWIKKHGHTLKVTGARLRKIINYIRCKSICPVIATSKGYFVSYEPEVIKKQIKSLRERASSINNCAAGLGAFL